MAASFEDRMFRKNQELQQAERDAEIKSSELEAALMKVMAIRKESMDLEHGQYCSRLVDRIGPRTILQQLKNQFTGKSQPDASNIGQSPMMAQSTLELSTSVCASSAASATRLRSSGSTESDYARTQSPSNSQYDNAGSQPTMVTETPRYTATTRIDDSDQGLIASSTSSQDNYSYDEILHLAKRQKTQHHADGTLYMSQPDGSINAEASSSQSSTSTARPTISRTLATDKQLGHQQGTERQNTVKRTTPTKHASTGRAPGKLTGKLQTPSNATAFAKQSTSRASSATLCGQPSSNTFSDTNSDAAADSRSTQRHLRKRESLSSKYTCPICLKRFPSGQDLIHHVQVYILAKRAEDGFLHCPHGSCRSKSQLMENLLTHMAGAHNIEVADPDIDLECFETWDDVETAGVDPSPCQPFFVRSV